MMFNIGLDVRPQYDELGYETEFVIVDVAFPESYLQFHSLFYTESTTDGLTTVSVHAIPEGEDEERLVGTFTVPALLTYEEFTFALANFLLFDKRAACVPYDVC